MPLPSPQQVAWQRAELTAFVHFGLQTFDGTEQGTGNPSTDPPSLFNPTGNVDPTQWVSALQGAGFKQAIFTAKHSPGFCMWPSQYSMYSVASSPWMNGKGNVVKLFADAMHAAGMRLGFYLAPWDQDFTSSSPGYQTYYENTMTELLTQYGPVYELWMDGNDAPTNLDWASIVMLAKQLQPDVLVEMGPQIATTGADIQWIGDEQGQSSRTQSSIGSIPNGGPSSAWYPVEADVSDRANWFWHPGDSPMSLGTMQGIYFSSIGMNATLIFNVPPAQTGQFDAADVTLLQQFGSWYSALYAHDLVLGQPVMADSTWATAGFEAAKAVDGDICTYWAGASGTTTGRLEVDASSPITLSLISIREPIEIGERTTGYHVEIEQNGTWNTMPTDMSGNPIQGTVIGQRQLWQLTPTTAQAIALVIDSAKDVPAIAEFGVY